MSKRKSARQARMARMAMLSRDAASGSANASAATQEPPTPVYVAEPAPKATIKHAPVAATQATYRCAITGKPIIPAAVKRRDYAVSLIHVDRKIADRDGDPRDRLMYRPTALNTHEPYPVDGGATRQDVLGGLQWHPSLYRWFGEETSTLLADALRDYTEWWRDTEILDALRMELGNERVDAVLAYISNRDEELDIDRAFNHSVGWTRKQYARASNYVRCNYRPKLREIGRAGLLEWAHHRRVCWPAKSATGSTTESTTESTEVAATA